VTTNVYPVERTLSGTDIGELPYKILGRSRAAKAQKGYG